MPELKEKDRRTIQEWFGKLRDPVRLVVFTQEHECEYCAETRDLAEQVAALSDKVSVEVHDFVAEEALAREYGIDKIPAVAIIGSKDYGVRYYGFPGGFEFTSFVEDIIDVSTGEHGLSEATLKELARLERPVHLQVFVTPTCPYCPRGVRLAHKLAIASDRVRADAVEAIEFPHLANKYQVYGVPLTVINEQVRVEGAVPEARLVQEVLRAVTGKKEAGESAWHG